MTETEACIEYIRSQCQRRAECGKDNIIFENCFMGISLCPDIFFSPGTTRTIESLARCATDWSAASCDDFDFNMAPKCATAGTRIGGEACVFSSQCASQRCSADAKTCGTCDAEALEGQACGGVGITCALGLRCDGNTLRCVLNELMPSPAPFPVVGLGEVCDRVAGPSCGKNDCVQDTDGVSRCISYPRLGDNCTVPKTCAFDDGSYCDISQLCLALPSDGQPCGVDAWTGTPSWCSVDSTCDGIGSTPTCRALPAVGAACTMGCAGEAKCVCTDATCSARMCQNMHLPGESCDVARSELCLPDVSRCEAGTCVLNGSQGIFKTHCMQ
jgi:hypothetical protein